MISLVELIIMILLGHGIIENKLVCQYATLVGVVYLF